MPWPRGSSCAPRAYRFLPRGSARAVEKGLGVSGPTIAEWRRPVVGHGVEGLTNRHEDPPPRKLTGRGREEVATAGREDALVLGAFGVSPRRQQEHRAAGLARGRRAGARSGGLHGAHGARVRRQDFGHRGALPGSASSGRGVLHRGEDSHRGPGPAGPCTGGGAGPGRTSRIGV